MGIKEIKIGSQVIIIHEHENINDTTTGCACTGSWLWNSAIVLSRWLATSNLNFQGKSVLELGAGTGLPGLTAAKLGASQVILTDVASLLPGLLKNVEESGLTDKVKVKELVWENDNSKLLSEIGEIDVVLMSDVFYDREQMGVLGHTLRSVCGDGKGKDVIILAASEVRDWTSDCLNELVISNGFQVVELIIMKSGSEGEGGGGGGGEGGGGGDDDDDGVFAVYCLIPPPMKANDNCNL